MRFTLLTAATAVGLLGPTTFAHGGNAIQEREPAVPLEASVPSGESSARIHSTTITATAPVAAVSSLSSTLIASVTAIIASEYSNSHRTTHTPSTTDKHSSSRIQGHTRSELGAMHTAVYTNKTRTVKHSKTSHKSPHSSTRKHHTTTKPAPDRAYATTGSDAAYESFAISLMKDMGSDIAAIESKARASLVQEASQLGLTQRIEDHRFRPVAKSSTSSMFTFTSATNVSDSASSTTSTSPSQVWWTQSNTWTTCIYTFGGANTCNGAAPVANSWSDLNPTETGVSTTEGSAPTGTVVANLAFTDSEFRTSSKKTASSKKRVSTKKPKTTKHEMTSESGHFTTAHGPVVHQSLRSSIDSESLSFMAPSVSNSSMRVQSTPTPAPFSPQQAVEDQSKTRMIPQASSSTFTRETGSYNSVLSSYLDPSRSAGSTTVMTTSTATETLLTTSTSTSIISVNPTSSDTVSYAVTDYITVVSTDVSTEIETFDFTKTVTVQARDALAKTTYTYDPVPQATIVSTDGRCGGNTGMTCKGYAGGECCSIYGFCGSSKEYCGPSCVPGGIWGICGSKAAADKRATTAQDSPTKVDIVIDVSKLITVVQTPWTTTVVVTASNDAAATDSGTVSSSSPNCSTTTYTTTSTTTATVPPPTANGTANALSVLNSAEATFNMTTTTSYNMTNLASAPYSTETSPSSITTTKYQTTPTSTHVPTAPPTTSTTGGGPLGFSSVIVSNLSSSEAASNYVLVSEKISFLVMVTSAMIFLGIGMLL